MTGFSRFGKLWASAGVFIPPTDAQANAGFAYLGPVPPSVESFNGLFNDQDGKDNWLYEQIANVIVPAGIVVTEPDITALLRAIQWQISNTPGAYVLKAGDTMTGNLSMTGAGIAINYAPPTALLFGAWQSNNIGFGWNGTQLRIRIEDVDTGVIDVTGGTNYVLKAGDIMTGNLAMTGTGIAINYDPPTTLLYGAWETVVGTPENIGFGWDGTSLRIKVADLDVGALQPSDALLTGYVLKTGDVMTGNLAMTGTGIAINYDPPTTLLYGPWEAVAGTPDNIGFGWDGLSQIRARVNDVDVGTIKLNSQAEQSFSFMWEFTVPAATVTGTAFAFTMPAAELPPGDFWWDVYFDFDNTSGGRGSGTGSIGGFIAGGPPAGFLGMGMELWILAEDMAIPGTKTWVQAGINCATYPWVDYVGIPGQPMQNWAGATAPTYNGVGGLARTIVHNAGENIQIELRSVQGPGVDYPVKFRFEGRIQTYLPIVKTLESVRVLEGQELTDFLAMPRPPLPEWQDPATYTP